MKHVTFGLCCMMLICSIWMIMLAANRGFLRRQRLKRTLHYALESAMDSAAKSESFSFGEDDLVIADVTALIMERLDTRDDITLELDVAESDIKRGILSVRVTEMINGKNGKQTIVEDEATVVLERLAEPKIFHVGFEIPQEVAEELDYPSVIEEYDIQDGYPYKVPQDPGILAEKNRRIISWVNKKTNESCTSSQLADKPVNEDSVFLAVLSAI